MVLYTTPIPDLGLHQAHAVSAVLQLSFVQPHQLSRARLIFLIVLVVFFCTLFMVSYIWMRRPSFGQGDRPTSAPIDTEGVDKSVATGPDGILGTDDLHQREGSGVTAG